MEVEVVLNHNKKAKAQLLDLLYNHYEVTPETIIVNNSDGSSIKKYYFYNIFLLTFNDFYSIIIL